MSRQPSLTGKQIDEYRLDEMLGEGGMASVYRALDTRLNRYVAVKVIRTALRAETDYAMRFEREAQAVAQLQHPNIIAIYRFGEQNGLLYMVMQFVDGADLAAVIDSFEQDGDHIEYSEVLRVAKELGAGLDYAHANGVIHRDVKPHNIMIDRNGRVLVTDFGLALMQEIGTHGEIFGSPHYIAPEQAISSAGAVPQSDQYAMGVVLYEMLTGVVPFEADEPLDIAMLHMSEPVPSPRERRPDLPEAAEHVLLRALEKKPVDRYASCRELATALETALTQKQWPVRHTITSKVELERAAHPLPPIPAEVAPTTQANQPAPTQQAKPKPETAPTPSRESATKQPSEQPRRGLWYVLGAVAILLVLGGGAFLVLLTDNTNPTPTAIPAAAMIASATDTVLPTTAAPSPTLRPTEAPLATVTPVPLIAATDVPIEPPTDVASASPPPYELTIRTRGEDSLFVINTGSADFPVAGLTLRGDGSVSGEEWGVDMLAPDVCLGIWKETGNPRPADTDCDQAGARLTRDGPNRFWKRSFGVFYDGVEVAQCERGECLVRISP